MLCHDTTNPDSKRLTRSIYDILTQILSRQLEILSRVDTPFTADWLQVCFGTRGLHRLKTEARTRPVPEIVWPDPTRPDPSGTVKFRARTRPETPPPPHNE